MENEEWRPIYGWEGFYSVSSLGRVRSEARIVMRLGLPMNIPAKIMKSWGAGPDRRPAVVLQDRALGRMWKGTIQILVCEAFHGPRPVGKEAAHNDGNSLNNHYKNLRWATPKENHADKIKHGVTNREFKSWKCKLSDDDVREIRKSNLSQKELAQKYNVRQSHISAIILRKERAHVC